MDKRYQVFVSSTYEDLQAERQEVMHALLELDCIPAGMELFPAANEDQWSLIKGVIDDCDYYLVIIAGRYGSVDSEGMSYTEKEYRYALEKEKPIIAFLHKEPGSIPVDKTEDSENGKERLREFRELAEKKMCKHWTTPAELGSVVSRSLINLIKRNPATGWVKADLLPDEDTKTEILNLRREVEALQRELEMARTTPPPGSEHLAQGDDKLEVRFTLEFEDSWAGTTSFSEKPFVFTWNEIFRVSAPRMIHEADEFSLRNALSSFIEIEIRQGSHCDAMPISIRMVDEDFNTIVVQLRSLGLITQSIKKRSLKDTKTYWTLTPYGDMQMVKLKALKRPNGQ